ncbi:KpsF/GutQ family sugar-phosphate isomerase [Tenacibaculum finnmarkense]|uniref:KpsF/GutQ family sugar-phosphate isomerase n=1 Tax=Tenacibaculum finnmarkense genomovar finnmarkense TaxID=1458503 RepID=A0AAP1RFV0_9FLAO|nr:KpsF/GutQ family sugar-phosphate isomerase [Tenacibaculum finnmarkense]MBE7652782.1 KpsF/GutQ family sugar-phosphate isomerase [Tenacibaculum finnmarkense genomovar finnmarkense]MBE7695172.1 KpsF/GutQ family sugar-phosphate isomerase [Tenacibaculum finnmarkense genomovar finnmarkense]MCD8411844.1 KpsF/GutQ family sugar-phosphate isomerase [Tenacibaculum finnmarkense genomovar ulcerans]MCD8427196.1 KpsF/GutQ family sugar-phosphate isomerase [Tenacibaculum finnmarkense genomovar finnmarkense]
MKDANAILSTAKETILLESNAIANLAKLLDSSFVDAVNFIFNSKGRVVITGIGKSANIASKMVATFNSTGTPSLFMHAADAIHGDLGSIQKDDVVICLSKSGNTPEIKVLVPLIKKANNKLIAISGNPESFLATNADFSLNSFVTKEACPNNLAPTSSTTAQLVLGDALAVCLLKLRGFTSSDFAKYHPGGALGKRLYLRVDDLIKNNQLPKVASTDSVANVIVEISEKRLGVTAVVNANNNVTGIITDGDIRRMLSKTTKIDALTANDIMSKNPKTINVNAMAVEALEALENNSITQILVTDNNSNYVGVVHLHDLIKEGIF